VQPNVQAQVATPEPEGDGILSKIGNAALKVEAATLMGAKKTADIALGLGSEAWKSILSSVDDIVNGEKNSLKQGGFFDKDIPETDKPISDAIKNKIELERLSKKAQGHDESPLDPRVIVSSIASVANKVINSTLRQDQRDAVVNRLAVVSNNIQSDIRNVENYQDKVLPKNLPTQVAKNIVGMAPDLILASAMENPEALESRAAKWTEKTTEKAAPIVKKYAPKAAKVLEESVVAPFTKIMAAKGAIHGMATAKENENPYMKAVEGSVEGAVEGMYMHGLGLAAGEVSKPISKAISKAGVNSAIATTIATPLANAGVFTTAKALRTAATENRMITGEEAAMEAGTGVGFSLLHLGSQFQTHNEANHYYDKVLSTNAANSLGRVLNETKENLDIAYNPNLTDADVTKLEEARDELKKAILKEPDLAKKKLLGDEAVKIQNQLDAHHAIKGIVENKDALIQGINDQENLSPEQKKFYIDKASAIADAYDMSDFAVTKRDLNAKITEAQKELDDAGEAFTNLKTPSDRAEAKMKVDEKKKQLDELNNQLTELITNKQKQDAIQKQAADEALLRAGQQRLGLQQVGEGNAESKLTPEQSQAITDEKDAFQEILDNPDNHDETDVQEAKDYFADPIKYYEGKIKFYEDEANPTEDDKTALEHFKAMLEAHKAAEAKPEGATIQAGSSAMISESTPKVTATPAPAKGTTITVGTGSAMATTSGGPTEVTTGGEGTETATNGANYGFENTKIEDDGKGNLTVTLDGKPIGRMVVDKEFGNYVNADFNKADAKPYTAKSIYGDVLGRTQEQAVNELLKRSREANRNDVTNAEGTETKTSVMDDIDLLVPKYKEYVDRDLQKAKDKLKVAKTKGDETKIEEAKKALDKAKAAAEEYKVEVATKKEEALKLLTESDEYKNADPTKQNELAREVAKKFGERQKSAPSAETITGQPKDEKVTMSGKDALKEQIKAFARGAKAGVQGVRDAITQIVDYVKGTDINTKDLKKVMDVLKSKIETETDLNKAIEKVFDIVDKSDTDIVEVSKTKIDKDKMKAELEGLKKGRKSVVEKVKAIREYFESVKEFGNLTRKDLSKVIREISKVKDEKTLDKAVDNINKIIDKAKTDILEISELKMIKDKMKGIKDAKKDLNEKRKLIAAAIDFIQKSGNVGAKKVGKMLRDIGKVNLEDDTKIEKIIEYAEKVFEDAAYDEKLSKANALKKAISKLSADAKKNVHLTTLGKAFAKLKTSMVDDIDAYIDVASKIKESLVGSKPGDKDNPVKAAEMVNIKESMDYINENMDAQLVKTQEEMAAEVLEKLGVDATGMSIDDMRKMLEEKSDNKKRDQTIIKDGVKKMFDSYTAIIKHIFETGKDPFTGEDMDFTDDQKKLVTEFMGMDLNLLDTKKSLEAMDALSNFLQNGSTAKMEDIVMKYKGEENARILESKGLKSKPLKFYFNGWIGRTIAEQIATLPTLTEMLFKSQSKSALFDKLSGLTEMRNKKTYVTTLSSALNNRYIKEFFDKKANGKDFTDVSNITERGVIAAVKRTMVGTPEEQQAEFNRKKKLIEDSIKHLKRGAENERKLGKIYEAAYDKLLKDSENVDDVLSKADNNNIDAVDFWINEWDKIYDKLADVSENVYNQILDRDVNYTPDRYTKLYNRGTAEELGANNSLFNGNNGSVFKKKTGVLEKIERSNELPKNEEDKISRYLDLSFDKTNVNAMYDALMDIHTAGTVRQIESFFKSDAIESIIPNAEDRAILYNDNNTGRVQDFIRASRNKQIIDSSEAAKAARRLSSLATIGTSTALGSVFQPLKQVVPVAINTLINTGGKLDFNYFMGPKAEFLDKVGYGISTRGLESQTQIKSINKLIDLAAKSKGAKAMEYIEKANQMYLKAFLQAPDVYIARASWMSYYEKALEKQGIDPKTIDYSDHEVNKEAADYAQKMVDRQQNISDHDLNGKLLASKKSGTKLMTSVVMPFASFRLNQFMRATNDIATLTSLNKDASITSADKRAAAASLAGYGAEMAAFKVIAYGVSLLMGNVTNYIMGKDESEEDKNKRENNLFRSQLTGTITDIISPLPPADILYAKGADKILGAAQDLAEVNDADKLKLMTSTKSNDFAKSLGVLGIGISKYQNLQDAASLAYSGQYTDEYGRIKYISENDRDALKAVVGISALANMGLLPSDANTIARNAIASAKRSSSTKQGGEEDQDETEMKKEKKEKATRNKISVLNDMLKSETDIDKKQAIRDRIKTLNETKEDKKDEKEITDREKAKKEKLLGGYDNEEDLKRYNKNLYEQNFGPNSDWYQEHKYEKMVNEELDKKLQKQEDLENNYYKPEKNSDGTKKRKKKEYSWSKYKKYTHY
jgi:hypothetical protein